MKKFLVAVVLAAAASAYVSAQSADQAQQGPTSSKTIKDPTEYNAYISATQQTDPAAKAAALEAFGAQYPSSVVREESLQGAMAAYQQAGNVAKATQAASTLLQAYPNNVDAIAVLVYGKRQTQDPQQLAEGGQLAQRGLQALQTMTKPEGLSDADYAKKKQIFSVIFNGAAGQAALVNKDYANAAKFMRAAVENNPNDVADVYPLGLAYLSIKPMTPENALPGLWYIARATTLVANNPQALQQINAFGKGSFKKYHGSEEGWVELVALAKTQPALPADLAQRITQYVPPSPAEQAADMLKQQPDPQQMGFGEWIFILTSGNQQASDAVWAAIQNKPLKFQGKVIEATPDTIGMAVTADGIEANMKEVEIKVEEPLKAAPTVGADFKVQATPFSFTVKPFLMSMEHGIEIGAKPAKKVVKKKAPAKRSAVRRKPTR